MNLGTGAVSLGTAAGTARTITTNCSVLTLGGVISNGPTANALIKAGGGTLVLTGANTYTGGTTVSAGTLSARSASALGSGNVSVGANAILNYQASTDAQLAIGGTLSLTGGTSTTLAPRSAPRRPAPRSTSRAWHQPPARSK